MQHALEGDHFDHYYVRDSVQDSIMGFRAKDVVSITQIRARFAEMAEEVKAGAEKIITKNGESYVALVDAERLDFYHALAQEHAYLAMLEDARVGLEDVAAGRTRPADEAIAEIQQRRRDAKATMRQEPQG